jgi:hypothetical protein
VIRAAPFVVFLYVFAGLAGARSEAPVLLNRYSFQAATLIVLCLVVFGLAATAWRRRKHGPETTLLETAALTVLVVVTLVMPGSNAVQRVPYVQYVLPVVRGLAAAALIAGQMARFRRTGAPNGPVLAAAAVLAVWASADVVIAAITRQAPPHAGSAILAFRHDYDLNAIPPRGLVLIGDSFVWGQGVGETETLGVRLEQRLRTAGGTSGAGTVGTGPPVYSLGAVGGGLTTYLATLSALPAGKTVDRIALVYYVNDMPPAPRLVDSFRSQMIALGVGAPTLRIVGDLAGRALTPTLDDYYAKLVADYDAGEPTFDARWRALSRQIEEFRALAAQRSRNAPLFVILPLMVDFAGYPLTDAHQRLGALATQLGFDVVDLLPVFRAQLGDGRRHLAAAEDNHFDAFTHDIVAAALFAQLGKP